MKSGVAAATALTLAALAALLIVVQVSLCVQIRGCRAVPGGDVAGAGLQLVVQYCLSGVERLGSWRQHAIRTLACCASRCRNGVLKTRP